MCMCTLTDSGGGGGGDDDDSGGSESIVIFVIGAGGRIVAKTPNTEEIVPKLKAPIKKNVHTQTRVYKCKTAAGCVCVCAAAAAFFTGTNKEHTRACKKILPPKIFQK